MLACACSLQTRDRSGSESSRCGLSAPRSPCLYSASPHVLTRAHRPHRPRSLYDPRVRVAEETEGCAKVAPNVSGPGELLPQAASAARRLGVHDASRDVSERDVSARDVSGPGELLPHAASPARRLGVRDASRDVSGCDVSARDVTATSYAPRVTSLQQLDTAMAQLRGEIADVETRLHTTAGDVTRADVTRADVTRADVTRADVTRADVTRADVTRADVTRADVTRADVTRADVTRADLTRADVTRADVTRADVTRADVTRADVTRADVTRADVTRADVTRADVTRRPAAVQLEMARSPSLSRVEQSIAQWRRRGQLAAAMFGGARKATSLDLTRSGAVTSCVTSLGRTDVIRPVVATHHPAATTTVVTSCVTSLGRTDVTRSVLAARHPAATTAVTSCVTSLGRTDVPRPAATTAVTSCVTSLGRTDVTRPVVVTSCVTSLGRTNVTRPVVAATTTTVTSCVTSLGRTAPPPPPRLSRAHDPAATATVVTSCVTSLRTDVMPPRLSPVTTLVTRNISPQPYFTPAGVPRQSACVTTVAKPAIVMTTSLTSLTSCPACSAPPVVSHATQRCLSREDSFNRRDSPERTPLSLPAESVIARLRQRAWSTSSSDSAGSGNSSAKSASPRLSPRTIKRQKRLSGSSTLLAVPGHRYETHGVGGGGSSLGACSG